MASDLGLHLLHMSNKTDARPIWVNEIVIFAYKILAK